MATLAPDVVWTADSNGKASAARRPELGAEKVAKLAMGEWFDPRFTPPG